jgi:hypothetical protein
MRRNAERDARSVLRVEKVLPLTTRHGSHLGDLAMRQAVVDLVRVIAVRGHCAPNYWSLMACIAE